MNRPERVLQKGEHQMVTCKCGHVYAAAHESKEATCPKCNASNQWGLRK